MDQKNKMLMVLGAVAAAIAVLALALSDESKPTVPLAELAATMADVAERWPDIPHIAVPEAAAKMESGNVVLFDVREGEEYAVSHLPGAIHVDPGTSSDDFLSKFANRVDGKDVVFYCSVGVRSSKLAARVKSQLAEGGATGVYDLAGGIFAWHSERRPLVNASGPTDYVHPFNASWGRLVVRGDLRRTRVE
jgi:rhodanese-related sulfurtransferase